jgi:hypothetical protein
VVSSPITKQFNATSQSTQQIDRKGLSSSLSNRAERLFLAGAWHHVYVPVNKPIDIHYYTPQLGSNVVSEEKGEGDPVLSLARFHHSKGSV